MTPIYTYRALYIMTITRLPHLLSTVVRRTKRNSSSVVLQPSEPSRSSFEGKTRGANDAFVAQNDQLNMAAQAVVILLLPSDLLTGFCDLT